MFGHMGRQLAQLKKWFIYAEFMVILYTQFWCMILKSLIKFNLCMGFAFLWTMGFTFGRYYCYILYIREYYNNKGKFLLFVYCHNSNVDFTPK